jgi:hypothetical protein
MKNAEGFENASVLISDSFGVSDDGLGTSFEKYIDCSLSIHHFRHHLHVWQDIYEIISKTAHYLSTKLYASQMSHLSSRFLNSAS